MLRMSEYARAYCEDSPTELVEKIDRATGEKTVKIRFLKRLPPKIRSESSSAIASLRHALDHGICDAAALYGASTSGMYFPFANDECSLDVIIAKKLAGLPEGILATIKAIRPIRDGDHLLWALNQAARISKHRRLVQIGLQVGSPELTVLAKLGNVSFETSWSDFHNELTFARMAPESAVKFDYRVPMDVVFGDVPLIGGEPVLETLTMIADKVDLAILQIEKAVSEDIPE